MEEKRRVTLNTPVASWELSNTYSELSISNLLLMNTPKIKFLGISFLGITLETLGYVLLSWFVLAKETHSPLDR